jgi:MFS family permease
MTAMTGLRNRCPVTASRKAPAHPTLGRTGALAAVVCALALTILGTTLPTPLNVLYRERFGWSELMITAISGGYGLGALVSLVLFNRLCAKVGHPALVLEGLALAGLGVAAFLISDRPAFLIIGHVLSGLSAGISVGAAIATLAPGLSIAACMAIAMPLIGEGVLAQATTLRAAVLISVTAVAAPAAVVALLLGRPRAPGHRVAAGVGVRTPVQPVMRPVLSRAVHVHRVGTGPAPRTAKGRARSLQCRPPLRPRS